MDKIFESVLNDVNVNFLLNPAHNKIVLGVSGGPDSIFMLNFFIWLNERIKEENKKEKGKNIGIRDTLELYVCHVNHQIREEAGYDQSVVEKICLENDLKFFAKSVNVEKLAKENGTSVEQQGRVERYKFFKEIYDKFGCNGLAIAHNREDNVETILLNIIRGCGLTGLVGLEAKSFNFGMNVIRPILNVSKKDILEFLDSKEICYAIDKTNFETVYKRNIVRNKLVPIFEEINPSFGNAIERLSSIAKEEEEFVKGLSLKCFEDVLLDEEDDCIVLNLKRFVELDKIIQKKILLIAIDKIFGNTKNIEKIHIEDILKLVNKNIGNKFLTPNKFTKVYVNKGKIFIQKI